MADSTSAPTPAPASRPRSTRTVLLLFAAAVAIVLGVLWNWLGNTEDHAASARTIPPPRPGSVVFTAVGDFGANLHTDLVLEGIKRAAPQFHLALGDFSYDEKATEAEWCSYVLSHVGEIPFQLVSGNHENNGVDGHIEKFIECLPNRIEGAVGQYGKEYYFDYPAEAPIARMILISPGLEIGGEPFVYKSGTPHFDWLLKTVEEAHAQGLWVVVGMHYSCVQPGEITCLMGPELMNYLASEADLILHAHSHNYLRSKQLTCVITGKRGIVYDETCVKKSSLGTTYKKGDGAVLAAIGVGGKSIRAIERGDTAINYFEKVMDANELPAYGFLRFEMTPEEIRADFISVEGSNFTDTFVIER